MTMMIVITLQFILTIMSFKRVSRNAGVIKKAFVISVPILGFKSAAGATLSLGAVLRGS